MIPPDWSELPQADKRALLARLLEEEARRDSSAHSVSAGQRALWFIQYLTPTSAAYNVMTAARVRHPLDARALRIACQRLVDRHLALRTTYGLKDGQPFQRVAAALDLTIIEGDATGWSDERLRHLLGTEADRPFDLATGPVLRVYHYRRAVDDHVLMLVVHHVAVDFWSFEILVHELRELYIAAATSVPERLPALRVGYLDHVKAETAWLSSAAGPRALEFWRRQLEGEVPVLRLPTDRSRPATLTYDGASIDRCLPAELCGKLRSVAAAERVTPYVFLLAAFQLLLGRYADQDDVVVGSPMAGRTLGRFDNVVGYFANPVPLRARLQADISWRALLASVQQTVLGAIEHQAYPFPLLVEQLNPPRDASRSPLFDAAFLWDRARIIEGGARAVQADDGALGASAPVLRLEPFMSGQRGAPVDVTMTVFEAPTVFSIALLYNRDLFDALTARRMCEHFEQLVANVVEDPGQALGDVSLQTPRECAQLTRWSTGPTAPVPPTGVHEMVEAVARRWPDTIAASGEGVDLTYGELESHASRLALRLRQMGVGAGSLVGVCLPRSADLVVALYAVLKAGAAYLPLDPQHPVDRRTAILSDSAAAFVLTHGVFDCVTPPHVRVVPFADRDDDRARARDGALAAPEATVAEDSLAYVIYTSGSTGHPKGVEVTHRAVVNLLQSMQAELKPTSRDIIASVTTIAFDIAALEIFLPLIVGARVLIVDGQTAKDGRRLAQFVESSGVTMMQATPTTWRLLIAAGWRGNRDLTVLCGGESLSRELADQLSTRCKAVWNLYGPTETTIWSSAYCVSGGGRHGDVVPIGRPLANTQMHVLDRRMRRVEVGIAGELYIGGAGVSPGYRGRPDLTAERFVHVSLGDEVVRVFRTGDLARVRDDGTFVCLGRLDDQVKIRGYRVELGEIEAVLRRHANVREAAVVCRSDRRSAPQLLAYVVADSISQTMPDRNGAERRLAKSLRQFLKTVLPDYMQPSDFSFVASIALTPSGKIDRRALTALRPSRRHVLSEPTSGHSELENVLLAGWSEVLGVPGLGVHDNFFELGGASLQTLQVTDLATRAGLTITPELVFRYQTVAELAAFLEDAESADQIRTPIAAEAETTAEIAAAITTPVNGTALPRAVDLVPGTSSKREGATGNTVIESLGVYLPARVASTASVLAGCDAPILFPLERMTGIRSRRMASETESSLDLATRAIEECLSRSKYRPSDVDLVINCSISRYEGPLRVAFEPSLSVQLRHRFGFEHALTFDLNSACTGMFTAIHLADTLIRAGTVHCALVVSGERISPLTSAAQREIRDFMDARLACLTLGDAGAAVILEGSQRSDVGFHDLELYTLGRYSDLCVAKLSDQPHGGAIMVTDAVRQTAVGIRNAVLHATHTLARRDWPPESFQHLIMHQTSETALRDAMRAINSAYGRNVCHDGNTVLNLAERGNTASTTHFVALADNMDAGRVQSGDRVVFGISGSGQTIGTGLYTIDDLPDRRRRGRVAPASRGENGRHGIRERPPRSPRVRIAGVGVAPPSHERRTALALATQAAEDCLRRASIDRSAIGVLIYVGVYRDEYLCEPALAAMLAGTLDLNADVRTLDGPTTLAFDITNGAVGFMNACYVAEQMIGTSRVSRALVVAAEIENNAIVSPQNLRGLKETGTAVLLERTSQPGVGFGNFAFVADTSRLGSERTYTQYVGPHTSLAICRESVLDDSYVRYIAETARTVLNSEGLVPADVTVVLPPAISPSFVRKLGRCLDLPRARCVNVAADGQDLFTSSIPYGMHEALADGIIRPGDIGLLSSAGSGVQAASAIYYF